MKRTVQQDLRGFTLIELVVVIAMVAALAALLLPVHASIRTQSSRAQCASNLRQLGIGYNVYAQDSYGWYPITHAGGNAVNQINGGYYTRWICFLSGVSSPTKVVVGQNVQPNNFTDFGSLYPCNLVGDGRVLYCPALTEKHSALGSSQFEPFLTTDSAGNVRGSYLVNFHTTTKNGVNNIRTFEKTTDVRSRVVFGMDFINWSQFDTGGNLLVDSTDFAHSQAKGWNVMFNDASVSFSRIAVRQMKLIWVGGSAWKSGSSYDAWEVNQLASLVETNSP